MEDVLIIGAGTAGLTAAIYARRAGLSCTIFANDANLGAQVERQIEILQDRLVPIELGHSLHLKNKLRRHGL